MSTRLNVQFSEMQKKSLEQMAEELSTTKAGVLKAALSLMEVTLRERRGGNRIGVIRDNKVVKEIIGIQ